MKENKSIIVGRLIGGVLALVSGYYCASRVTHTFLSKDTPSDVFIILNLVFVISFLSINKILGELMKIRKKLEK